MPSSFLPAVAHPCRPIRNCAGAAVDNKDHEGREPDRRLWGQGDLQQRIDPPDDKKFNDQYQDTGSPKRTSFLLISR